jgi:hypothetical protein
VAIRFLVHNQSVADVDALDHQRLAFQLHLPDRRRRQPAVVRPDLPGLQRTAEGSCQSPRSGRHDVVEGRGSGLVVR